MLLAVTVARRIATPIAVLATTARLVQGGNRAARATLAGPAEVAEVAAAFNAMTESLHATAQTLEVEIAERKHVESQVRQLAFHDQLTMLPNRLLLNDRLSQAMAASARSGLHGALMFLDLDNFKPLNDTHGHDVGDRLLVEAANRLKSCMRLVDTVARFGGDEFVVVLCELDVDKTLATSQASTIAEKIRTLMLAPYTLTIAQPGSADRMIEHCCTTSIGIVLFVDHDTSQTDILKCADAAMYQAKKAGRNAIRFWTT